MRTTVTIDDELIGQVREIVDERSVSRLITRCLEEWLLFRRGREVDQQLAREYDEGATDSGKVADAFSPLDAADWPEEW